MNRLILKTILFLGLIALTGNCSEKNRIICLLQTLHWDSVSTAVSMISRDIDVYKKDQDVQREYLDVLKDLTESYKPNGNFLPRVGESGELAGDIVFAAMKLEIPNAECLLVDWAERSNVVGEYTAAKINLLGCSNHAIIDSILNRFNMADEYYKDRQDSYLEIVAQVLDKDTTCAFVKKSTYMMLKKILRSANPLQRLDATNIAARYVANPEIRKIVDSLSTADGYIQKRKGKDTYPVRIAAQKALAESVPLK